MKNRKILLLTSLAFVAILTSAIAFAAELKKPMITFDKNSYSDTDNVEITIKAIITQGLFELKNDEIISIYLGQKTSNSQDINLWSNEYSCPANSLECSNKWTFKVNDVKDNKFYAKVRAKVDGEIVPLMVSDAYSLPTGSGSNPGDVANRPPTVEISVDKTSILKGESVKVTVKGSDKDRNLKNIWFISNSNGAWGKWEKFSCSNTESCENTWTETLSEEGTSYFGAYAQDYEGAWSEWSSTGFITVKSGTSALKLSSGLNRFVVVNEVNHNMIGKSIQDFEGYNIKCGPNIWIYKVDCSYAGININPYLNTKWEEKSYDYKFTVYDANSALVVYCAP